MADLFLQRQWDILINRLVADPDYFSHFPNLQSLQIQIIYPRDRTAFTIDRIKIFIKAVQRASFSSVSLQMFTNLDVQDKYMQYFLEQLNTVPTQISQYQMQNYETRVSQMLISYSQKNKASEQWHVLMNILEANPDYFRSLPHLRTVKIQITEPIDRQTFTFDSIRIFIEAVKKATFSSASLQIFTNLDVQDKYMQYFLEQLRTVSDKFYHCPLYPPKPQHKIKKMAKVKEVSEQWHIFINKLKEDPDYFTHFPKLYSVQIQIIDTMDRQTFTFDSIRIFIEAVKKTTFSSASLQIFTNQDEDKQKHMQYFLEQLSTVSDKFSQCQTQNLIEIDGGSALKI